MKTPHWLLVCLAGGRGKKQPPRLRIVNLTRESVLGSAIDVASRGGSRSKGLLGRDGLAPGGGLWIVPCEAVHTFWMRFPIDLVYLDRAKRVKKVRSNVQAWRISGCLTAHSVLELPAGTVQKTRTRRGDQLEFSAVNPVEPTQKTSLATGMGTA